MTRIVQDRTDVDEVAVHRCLTGHPPAVISVPELDAVIRILLGRGMAQTAIAHHIRVPERTVTRHLPRLVSA